MSELKRTVLYQAHVDAGADMVDFGGWDMPVQYPSGIIAEHLFTRSECSLFDVSHMGRLIVGGPDRLKFLQKVLTNDASALDIGRAQYTIIPAEDGSAVDDAYLYRFTDDRCLLVINAANIEKDKEWLLPIAEGFDCFVSDISGETGSIAVQGPKSRDMLSSLKGGEAIASMKRNDILSLTLEGRSMMISRTGYTGEPLGYEVFASNEDTVWLWGKLLEMGAKPAGLGARDTLRMEASMPLYGHEMGLDADGKPMPIYAVFLAKFAVSFAEGKEDMIGYEALAKQHEAFLKILEGDHSLASDLPRRIQPITLLDRGVIRAGMPVFKDGEQVGWVTSGTMIPYHVIEGEGKDAVFTGSTGKRAIGAAYMDSTIAEGDKVEVEVRGRRLNAVVSKTHLKNSKIPYAIPVING